MKNKLPRSKSSSSNDNSDGQKTDEKTFVIEKKIHEAVDVLKKVVNNQKNSTNDEGKKRLFEQDTDFVFLQFSLKKVPLNNSTYIHYIPLKYHWRHELSYETCLIVKDKNEQPLTDRDADLEQTKDFYRNLLDEHSAKELISEILPMRQLLTEFHPPALRKRLSNVYNVFLCDQKLLRNKHSFLSRFLGKAFWIDNKKVPILLNFNDKNLKDQIENKLNQTSLYVSGKGSTQTIRIGSLQQDTEKLTANLMACLEKIKQLYGNNVRDLAIKTEKSKSIIFYMDLGSANEITMEKRKENEMDEFVEEEFDFIPNANIRVYKDGRIRIVKRDVPEEEDIEDDLDNLKTIKAINTEPDDEQWTRRLVFNRPENLRKRKIIQRRNRQYHLTNGRHSNSCPILQRNFLPPSRFDSLMVEQHYNFIDSNATCDSPITAIAHRPNSREFLNEKFHGHNCAVFDAKWRPEHSNQILTAAGDRSIILWDIDRTDQSLASFFPAHQGSVKSLSFHCPNTFISGGRDGAIKIWDLRTSCILRHGPVLSIHDPHIHILPSIKSPNFRSLKFRRQNPIAWASQNANYHPSNVVTCVDFHPINNNYFYSSGIADDSIKVWDIRQCRRQFQCTIVPTPTKIHTTKNISLTSSIHGYSSFFISNNGSILYASSTNGSIYAFTSNSTYPVMILSGRYSNSQTKISPFSDDYLLSGSTNSRFYIWNCSLRKPFDSNDENFISIENRLPLFEMNFDHQQELSLIFGDFSDQNIYCASEPHVLWKWSFGIGRHQNSNEVEYMQAGYQPTLQRFKNPENHSKMINISLKRASSFEAITHRRSSSLTRPLSTITNWISSGTKRFKSNDNNNNNNDDDDSAESPSSINGDRNIDSNNDGQENRRSKSTSHKLITKKCSQTRGLRKNLKRNLFSDNRKISEFFTKSS
ncbi:wd domain containing protein [Dermatophagoides farinae]|uniref:Wd domain containing protein n=1 Tax=Dermatophagoides farinae TaxID=6954 RepID=A0A9D4SCT3_DERFA|nr:wd domain containing protein [Dermatophagoides farinae]